MKNNGLARNASNHVADMSLPPEERGRSARKRKRTTQRKAGSVPAQMSHGNSPKARKNARDQAKKASRQKKKRQRG